MTDGSSAPTVAELMSTPVVTGSPDETLAEAAGRMREKRVGSVVVVQDEKPVGILTEREARALEENVSRIRESWR